jgi:hypothetical protein
MKNGIVIILAFCVMALGGYSTQSLGDTIHPPQQPAGLDAHETNAAASVIGQFRTSVSSWLWLRTDLYLHNGVQMRPMTEDERREGLSTQAADEDGHEQLLNESALTTVIPSKDRDFRGVFGDVERAVGTYQDMHHHVHNDPKVALPLFRLMTWIDPQFIPGWTTGASVIARDTDKSAAIRAATYLKEGLAENPESIALLTDLGRLSAVRFKNLPRAIGYLEKARELGLRNHERLPEIEVAALDETYRWLALSYRDLGELQKMTAVLKEGLKVFPDDLMVAEMLNPPPTILTKEGLAAWRQERVAH